MANISALTSTANPSLAIGPNGATNPTLSADSSVGSAATGVKAVGRAEGSGASLVVTSSGTNEKMTIDAKGSGKLELNGTATGDVDAKRNLNVTGKVTGTSNDAAALSVGPNGATNPCLQVDGSTSSAATGVKVTGKAAAAGAALAVISSGTNEALTIDAKGSGTVTIGGTSTGAIALARNTAVTGTLAASGNVAINTDKFTVNASNGNTVAGGTMTCATSLTIGSTPLSEANLIALLALL